MALFQAICKQCQLYSRTHPLLGILAARCGSTRASVAKTNRSKFTRFYPTMIVNTDGSTYWIKHKEPSYILKLPLDVNLLSAEERKQRLKRYVPKKKETVIQDDLGEDTFDSNKYKHMWTKKR